MSYRYLDYDGLVEYTEQVKALVADTVTAGTVDLSDYAKTADVESADASTLAEAEAYADSGDSTTLATAEAYTDGAVSAAVSGVYTVCGSCAYADLPEDAETGDVYNITDDFTMDGEDYPAGTNVVMTDDGWDALAGITDLSAYATTDYVDEAVAGIDLTGYATETYVDEAVAGIDLSGYAEDSDLEVYVKSAELVAITTAEVDALFA